MKYLLPLFLLAIALATTGCAMENWNRNPLQSLTDKQANWFEQTGEHFRFNK